MAVNTFRLETGRVSDYQSGVKQHPGKGDRDKALRNVRMALGKGMNWVIFCSSCKWEQVDSVT